ncbi:MAG: purine-nucleoside phosphorylase [Bacteroidales bacterium]
MSFWVNRLKETSTFLGLQGVDSPAIGVILGTGLKKLAEKIAVIHEISYSEIPHFPVSTVEFHKGTLLYGNISGKTVLAMNGRFHFYEGYSMQEITFPVRVMKALGIKHLLISNAAGSMNPNFKKGELMLIEDHINLLGTSPLIGVNHHELGTGFPDMSQPYSALMNEKLKRIAVKEKLSLHSGVYVAVTGPNLETRAEYRFLRMIGADAVGMSTVPEVIAANHAGLPCAAISVLTDECDPDQLKPIDISDIMEAAAAAEESLIILFEKLISEL